MRSLFPTLSLSLLTELAPNFFANYVPIVEYASAAALNTHMIGTDYNNGEQQSIGAAVIFNGVAPAWDISIRLNSSDLSSSEFEDENGISSGAPETKLGFFPFARDISDLDNVCESYSDDIRNKGCLGGYLSSHTLLMQRAVSDFILNITRSASRVPDTKGFQAGSRIVMQNFPVASYEEDGFWGTIEDLFSLLYLFSFLYPVMNMIRELVYEKETKIKEGMKMMSLGTAAHILSWVFHFSQTFVIIVIFITLFIQKIFVYSSVSIIFMYFFLFLAASLSFCFWVASIFSQSKTAGIVGLMLYFAGYILSEINVSSKTLKRIFSIHPVAAFVYGTDAFVEYEDAALGITTASWSISETPDAFVFKDIILVLFFDVFFWAILAWYCENVIPGEWGTHRTPWFCFTPRYWAPTHRVRSFDELQETVPLAGSFEPVSDELLAQEAQNKCITMKNLRKTFSTKTGPKHAVDGLDLQFFNGQITALLGHNGAGKTSCLAMLTGLSPISSGHFSVNGLDGETEMAKIRQDLGVCPQHDILFPDLTVREHLIMYAMFKGLASADMAYEVDSMIKEVGLVEKADTVSKSLSGGMKRKLSVGIAFIGGSSTILLDEPTSGMDPYSRRFTWNVIKKMREGRTIVLTTHFMVSFRCFHSLLLLDGCAYY
jgi:ABC-type Na+ transport system ATPase subunit NatA